jgi:hypothetical protein
MQRKIWENPKIQKVILKAVKSSPDNLQRAFEKVAEKLSVPKVTIQNAWYYHIRYVCDVYVTGSEKQAKINLKNEVRRPKSENSGKFLTETESIRQLDGLKVVTIRRYYSTT